MHNVKNIIFDLDGTLYPNSAQVEDEIRAKMFQFLLGRLGLTYEEAKVLLAEWFKTYDGQLTGIKKFPQVTQAEFMDYICDVPLHGVKANPDLSAKLNQLSQRVFIFTDSTHTHVRDTLAKIGITRKFDGVFTSLEGDFILKPHLQTYSKMLDQFGIKAEESVFIEDNPRNIASGKEMGMKTVFISEKGENSTITPYSFTNINEALKLFV